MSKRNYHFDTLQVHAGQAPDPTTGSRAVPIYQTTSYVFSDAQEGADRFALKKFGNIYTRLTNPTTAVFEDRIAALEGGTAAVATASGLSAQFLAISNLAEAGDNIVSTSYIYGGTHNQFKVALRRFGIEVRFADGDDVRSIASLIDPRTKAIYLETIGNPEFNVPDFEPIVELARKHDIAVITDNTFGAGGYLFRPIEWGVNVVTHSATKWIGGHGTSLGGVVVDGGNFDWGNGKYPSLTEPDESYHGLRYTESFGRAAYITKARVQLTRDLGVYPPAQAAFYTDLGLQTLPVRMQRHAENAMQVAEFLNAHPGVNYVNYPGLKNDKYHELAMKYLPKGQSGVMSFSIKGGREGAVRFMDRLQLANNVVHVADVRTCVLHPASATHRQLTSEQLAAAGIDEALIRLSVGLENVDDIIADLAAAF